MKTRSKVIITTSGIALAASIAAHAASVHVLFRLQQLWKPEVDGTPNTIQESFHPSLSTNVVICESLTGLSPMEFYLNAFGPKPKGIEWVSAMAVLRYQPATTNFIVVERFRWKQIQSDTNYVSRLLDDDILFYHGIID